MTRRKLSRLCLALALALLFGSCSKKQYHMPSSSMDPTIPPGSDVVVDQSAYRNADPARWDIVTFEPPSSVNPGGSAPPSKETWIMRIIGMPGETVDFGGSEVLVSGKPIKPPSTLKGVHYLGLAALKGSSAVTLVSVTLAKDEYFVLGDNTTNANDSRFWGALNRSRISGKFEVP